MEQLKGDAKKWNDTQLFRYRLSRQMVNMSTERLVSRLNTKQNWYTIVPFPGKQSNFPFRNLEQRWNRTISIPCEPGLSFLFSRPMLALVFESQILLGGYNRSTSRKIFKQIKITSYNPFQTKLYKSTSGSKSMYSFLDKLILYSFLIVLEQSTRIS